MHRSFSLLCTLRYGGLAALVAWIVACDPDGHKDCAWVLEPEPKLIGRTEDGYIPVCARNRHTMKQDCRIQATMEQAQNYFGKTFRYVDLKVKSVGLPRTLDSITLCTPEAGS